MSESEQVQPVSGRIESIDVLRGFDMFWIIGGGAIFASLHKVFNNDITATIKEQLEHVPWEGFRFEDLIMPLFMFIVGVVMPYSFSRRLERGHGGGRLFAHVCFARRCFSCWAWLRRGDFWSLTCRGCTFTATLCKPSRRDT